jgi:hypothetical protein
MSRVSQPAFLIDLCRTITVGASTPPSAASQASLGHQTCTVPQWGHFERDKTSGRQAKVRGSLSMPVEKARPVFGHVIITTPTVSPPFRKAVTPYRFTDWVGLQDGRCAPQHTSEDHHGPSRTGGMAPAHIALHEGQSSAELSSVSLNRPALSVAGAPRGPAKTKGSRANHIEPTLRWLSLCVLYPKLVLKQGGE